MLLDKIHYFCSVVELGSISNASKEHGISISAGSRWIAELESSLGVTLLHRTTHKVSPSTDGINLYKRFSASLKEVSKNISDIKNAASDNVGEIRIASTPLFANYTLPKIISSYLKLHPKIKFKLINDPFPVDLSDDFDFSIRALATHIGKLDVSSEDTRIRLFSEPLKVTASRSYLDRHGAPSTPDDLIHHYCLYALSLVGGERWEFKHAGKHRFFKLGDAVQCDNSEILRRLTLDGAGISYLPQSLVQDDIRQGRLQELLHDYVGSTFDIVLYYRNREFMPARLADFKNFVVQSCKGIKSVSEARDAF